jgi:hypothetical protein
MSLRIRRGLNSQRSSVVLDTGEIAWATDTKKLYVGDGSTSGGVHVLATSVDETSGLAWDNTTQKIKYTGALGSALSNVVEDTSPELGGDLNLNNRTINGTGNINFTGGVAASTLSLSTGLSANLPLNNRDITGTGNINVTGTVTSSGTLTAGNISTAGTLTVNTGLGANLLLNTYNINGIGNINITGSVTSTSVTTAGLTVNSTSTIPVKISAITNGISSGSPYLTINASRGTISSPTTIQAGDILGGIRITGYINSTRDATAGFLVAQVEAGAVLTDPVPKSSVAILAGAGSGVVQASLSSNGAWSAPIIKVGSYAAISYPAAPSAGMIIFDSTANKFVGYNGTIWVDLS